MVRDRQRVAVPFVGRHELAFRAPKVVWLHALRKGGPPRGFSTASASSPNDDSRAQHEPCWLPAPSRHVEATGADAPESCVLPCAASAASLSRWPTRSAPAADYRTGTAVECGRSAFESALLIPLEDFVAGLPRDAELPATLHGIPSSAPPRGRKGVTHVSDTFCYLCFGTLAVCAGLLDLMGRIREKNG